MLRHTNPLLSITVLQVIQVFVFPVNSNAQQVPGVESILSQDDKIDKEPGCGLNHTWRKQEEVKKKKEGWVRC